MLKIVSVVAFAIVATSASAQRLAPWQPPSHNLLPQQQWDLYNQPTWQQEEAWREQQQTEERRHRELLRALRQRRQRDYDDDED